MNSRKPKPLFWLMALTVVVGSCAGISQELLPSLMAQANAREIVKMSPRIREYESAVIGSTLSVRDLRSLIPKITIFDDDLRKSGELVDFFDSVMGRPGARVEATGLDDHRDLSRFDIYTPCSDIENPDGFRDLGCFSRLTAQATRVANTRRTDILRLDSTFHAVFRGQRIIPRVASSATSLSELYRVDHPVSGKVVKIVDGLSAGSQYRVVVINLGKDSKINDGAVLTIYRNNMDNDPFIPDLRPKWRQVSSNEVVPIGQLVIFDVFKKASLGLVLRAEREVSLSDFVRN